MTNVEREARYHVWTVGDRLRAARETVTSDRKRFAEMIGVSADTVRNYERDVYRPKPPMLAAWCLATGFDKDWLLTGRISHDVSAEVTLYQDADNPGEQILLKDAA